MEHVQSWPVSEAKQSVKMVLAGHGLGASHFVGGHKERKTLSLPCRLDLDKPFRIVDLVEGQVIETQAVAGRLIQNGEQGWFRFQVCPYGVHQVPLIVLLKKTARTYKMRRVLMYGRYCLDEATRRETSGSGQTIYEVVGRRVKRVKERAKQKPPHVQLWKQTEKKS